MLRGTLEPIFYRLMHFASLEPVLCSFLTLSCPKMVSASVRRGYCTRFLFYRSMLFIFCILCSGVKCFLPSPARERLQVVSRRITAWRLPKQGHTRARRTRNASCAPLSHSTLVSIIECESFSHQRRNMSLV